jgi:RimJ/RimL family protein N-acetyltransferase
MPFTVSPQPQYLLLQWAADRLELPGGMWTHDSRAVGVFDEEKIRACLVMNKFSGEGCEASFVSDGSKRWITASVVRDLLAVPFQRFQMRRVLARVAETDVDTQIAALRIGFKFEARLRQGMWDDRDAILFSMMAVEMPEEVTDGGR